MRQAAPVLQRSSRETEVAINSLAAARSHGNPVIDPVQGVPAGQPFAYRLSDSARAALRGKLQYLANLADRDALIQDWAHSRGRVSSTEVADLTGLSVQRSGAILLAMESEGTLQPNRSARVGRGFFYIPVPETAHANP